MFLIVFVFLVFGQPVTVILVVWCICTPFWAVNAVGMLSLVVQGFPVAASAEYGPVGSSSWNVLTGTSGIWWNVLLVIPCLLM